MALPLLAVAALLSVGYFWLVRAEQARWHEQVALNASDLHNRIESLLYQCRNHLRALEGLF